MICDCGEPLPDNEVNVSRHLNGRRHRAAIFRLQQSQAVEQKREEEKIVKIEDLDESISQKTEELKALESELSKARTALETVQSQAEQVLETAKSQASEIVETAKTRARLQADQIVADVQLEVERLQKMVDSLHSQEMEFKSLTEYRRALGVARSERDGYSSRLFKLLKDVEDVKPFLEYFTRRDVYPHNDLRSEARDRLLKLVEKK